MAEFSEVMKIKRKMCAIGCINCDFFGTNVCGLSEIRSDEECKSIESQLLEWDKEEHKMPTYSDKFKYNNPGILTTPDGSPSFPLCSIDDGCAGYRSRTSNENGCGQKSCYDCWSKPYGWFEQTTEDCSDK